MKKVGIVGGGIAGLVCAYECQKRGIDFALFEKSPELGGVLGTSALNGASIENAANGFLAADGGAVELCEELDVEMQGANPESKIRRLYKDGKLIQMPNGPKDFLAGNLLGWKAKSKLALEPFVKPGHNDTETVHELLCRRFGNEIGELASWLLVTGIFAGDPRSLEAASAFPWLVEFDKNGGVIRNLVKKAKASKHQKTRGMQAPVDGVGALIKALESQLSQAHVHRGKDIKAVEESTDGFKLLSGGESFDVEQLILATPAHVSSGLVNSISPELSLELKHLDSLSLTVVSFIMKKDDLRDFDGYGFLVFPRQSLSMCGTVFESSVWRQRSKPDTMLVRCMMGGVRDLEFIDKSDEDCIESARNELSKIMGQDITPLASQVKKWRSGIPQYAQGHKEWAEHVCSLAEHKNIHLVGSSYRGVSVNDCIKNARNSIKRIESLLTIMVVVLTLAGTGLVFGGCSGTDSNTKKETPKSETKEQEVISIVPIDSTEEVEDSEVDGAPQGGKGRLSVTPTWLWPKAEFRDDQKVNSCGAKILPKLSTHVMGGVLNALVEIEGVSADSANTEIVIETCKPTLPVESVSLGDDVLVSNHDERSHKVFLQKFPSKETKTFYLNGLGQTVKFDATEDGVWRLHTDADPKSVIWIRVSEHKVLKTDERGTARLWDVPRGRYKAVVYHPPVVNEGVVKKDIEFEVKANQTTSVTLPMRENVK